MHDKWISVLLLLKSRHKAPSIKVTRHLFIPFRVNEDIRSVNVKTQTSIKLKGYKAPPIFYSFYRIYKAPLESVPCWAQPFCVSRLGGEVKVTAWVGHRGVCWNPNLLYKRWILLIICDCDSVLCGPIRVILYQLKHHFYTISLL